MESNLKEEYYQIEEEYLKENIKKQIHTKVHVPWNKVKPKIEKKNKDKHVNSKRREAKKIGNIVFEVI